MAYYPLYAFSCAPVNPHVELPPVIPHSGSCFWVEPKQGDGGFHTGWRQSSCTLCLSAFYQCTSILPLCAYALEPGLCIIAPVGGHALRWHSHCTDSCHSSPVVRSTCGKIIDIKPGAAQ